MNPIDRILSAQAALILDGAFSTELERKGCDLNDPLWSAKILMENPDAIAAVHEDYYIAGADCVITASYQATYEGFMARGLSKDEARKLIADSVLIARNVRDTFWSDQKNRIGRQRPLVAASIGPYGAFLADGSEYKGGYGLSEEELMAFHRERLDTLIAAEPDILACETIPCLLEAKALVKLLSKYPGVYCWISFSAKNGECTNNGETIEECAAYLDAFDQVAAIGVNCTAPEYIESLICRIKSKTDKPIIVYPNGGQQYDPLEKVWLDQAPADLAYGERSRLWHSKGAKVIGGCCKTTPDDIAKIAAWVRG